MMEIFRWACIYEACFINERLPTNSCKPHTRSKWWTFVFWVPFKRRLVVFRGPWKILVMIFVIIKKNQSHWHSISSDPAPKQDCYTFKMWKEWSLKCRCAGASARWLGEAGWAKWESLLCQPQESDHPVGRPEDTGGSNHKKNAIHWYEVVHWRR